MAALKLSSGILTCLPAVGFCHMSLLIQFAIFLVLGMTVIFQLKPGHFRVVLGDPGLCLTRSSSGFSLTLLQPGKGSRGLLLSGGGGSPVSLLGLC